MVDMSTHIQSKNEPMSDAIELPLDDDDRLAEPPLIDALHYEREKDGFSITFIPSLSEDPTRNVFVPRDSPEGRQVAAYLYRIQTLIGSHVIRAVHRGGGDYSLHLAGGTVLNLPDERSNSAPELFDRLKQIASVAEVAFGIAHAEPHR
jgi:hypothetical protein